MRAYKKHLSGPRPGARPIVNHMNFTDARPTISSPSTSFNPGARAGPLPNGPTKYPPGESRVQRNVSRNLTNSKAPY